jgi:hypothetical protein
MTLLVVSSSLQRWTAVAHSATFGAERSKGEHGKSSVGQGA